MPSVRFTARSSFDEIAGPVLAVISRALSTRHVVFDIGGAVYSWVCETVSTAY